MKKDWFKLLSLVVFVVFSLGLSSCGDDDDENTTSSIVGTWESEWEDEGYSGFDIVTFRNNNTGHLQEYYYDGRSRILEDDEEFDYNYDESSGNLYLVFGDEMEVWHVDMITSSKMVIDGDVYTKK